MLLYIFAALLINLSKLSSFITFCILASNIPYEGVDHSNIALVLRHPIGKTLTL